MQGGDTSIFKAIRDLFKHSQRERKQTKQEETSTEETAEETTTEETATEEANQGTLLH